ncbi:MAG: hypothetical protein ACR2KJ_02210 [Jatrophihabitans sp.]
MTGPSSELAGWSDLAPLIRRAAALDPAVIVRLTLSDGVRSVWVQLPFDVLGARTVPAEPDAPAFDLVGGGSDVLSWLDGIRLEAPPSIDLAWPGTLPPRRGWQRLDRVPDSAIREVVRAGALEIKGLSTPGGSGSPRTEQALLDAVVLTATQGTVSAPITLRSLAALTRMGFLPRDSEAAVDVAGRWMRVAAEFGSVYAERAGGVLNLLS